MLVTQFTYFYFVLLWLGGHSVISDHLLFLFNIFCDSAETFIDNYDTDYVFWISVVAWQCDNKIK